MSSCRYKKVTGDLDQYMNFPPPIEIEARSVNASRTLALHKPIRNREQTNRRNMWTISHIPTGLSVLEFTANLKTVTKALNCLDTTDWNFGEFGQSQLFVRDQSVSMKYALCLCWESIYGEPHHVLGVSSQYEYDGPDDLIDLME